MQSFDKLLHLSDTLIGPSGCMWDKKQTFQSLQPYVLEEAHELIEAVDINEDEKIVEELGDLLYTIIFYTSIANKEKRFCIGDVIDAISEKLIRRHPHVFGDLKVKSEKELEENWERIKKEEKGKETRRDPLDGIPPTLPLLARFQKIIKAVSKSSLEIFDSKDFYEISEEALAGELMFFIWLAEKNNIDAEGALRRSLQRLQDSFLKNG
ncbi:MAG: MazG family protein [Chlamydiae bacterium]|nr:MazG family protein [Chlamydiota bacterium]